MTNEEILKIALQQSAYDCNCNPQDFLSSKNKIVLSKPNEKARVYVPLPLECDLVSYGNNIVAQVSSRLKNQLQNILLNFLRSIALKRRIYMSWMKNLRNSDIKHVLWQSIFCRILPNCRQ